LIYRLTHFPSIRFFVRSSAPMIEIVSFVLMKFYLLVSNISIDICKTRFLNCTRVGTVTSEITDIHMIPDCCLGIIISWHKKNTSAENCIMYAIYIRLNINTLTLDRGVTSLIMYYVLIILLIIYLRIYYIFYDWSKER